MHLQRLLELDDGAASRSRERLHRGHPGRRQTFGIIVDRVFDTEEIVVKPVAPMLRHIDCSPATPSWATAASS